MSVVIAAAGAEQPMQAAAAPKPGLRGSKRARGTREGDGAEKLQQG